MLNQQKPACDFEVIIVDNEPPGTQPSETEKTLGEYRDPRLIYYRNTQNIGLVGNWNRCITLARGPWIVFLHDDDMLVPDYINKMLHLLGRRKNIAGIMVLHYLFYEDESAGTSEKSFRSKLYDRLGRGKLTRLRMTDSNIKLGNVYGPPTCGSIFRKDCLVSSGGFDDSLYPSFDWAFLYRFCGEHKLYRTMERLGYYRMFANESLKDTTKAAFLRQRIMFRDFAAQNTRIGKVMKRLFLNEQNNTILSEEYSDYAGKAAGDYFKASEIEVRKTRQLIYRLATQGYWHMKSVFCLIFG